jgi:hypothetical protein
LSPFFSEFCSGTHSWTKVETAGQQKPQEASECSTRKDVDQQAMI